MGYFWSIFTTLVQILEELFRQVCESATVPEEWHQGIIVPIYKGKGSRSEYKNCQGITAFSTWQGVHTCDTLSYQTNPAGLYKMSNADSLPTVLTTDRIPTLCNWPNKGKNLADQRTLRMLIIMPHLALSVVQLCSFCWLDVAFCRVNLAHPGSL